MICKKCVHKSVCDMWINFVKEVAMYRDVDTDKIPDLSIMNFLDLITKLIVSLHIDFSFYDSNDCINQCTDSTKNS